MSISFSSGHLIRFPRMTSPGVSGRCRRALWKAAAVKGPVDILVPQWERKWECVARYRPQQHHYGYHDRAANSMLPTQEGVEDRGTSWRWRRTPGWHHHHQHHHHHRRRRRPPSHPPHHHHFHHYNKHLSKCQFHFNLSEEEDGRGKKKIYRETEAHAFTREREKERDVLQVSISQPPK